MASIRKLKLAIKASGLPITLEDEYNPQSYEQHMEMYLDEDAGLEFECNGASICVAAWWRGEAGSKDDAIKQLLDDLAEGVCSMSDETKRALGVD